MDANKTLLNFKFDDVDDARAVTGLIKALEPVFDLNGIVSRRVARKNNKSQAEVLAEWKEKRDVGRELGTALHEYIAGILNHDPRDPIEGLSDKSASMRQFDRFWQTAVDQFTVTWVEKSVASDYLKVRGRVDALLYNTKTTQHHIVDWKRGAFSSKGWDPLAPPFGDLLNSPLVLGGLQTSIYRVLIEHYTGVELGESYLVFLSEFTYTAKLMPDFRERVKRWLLTGVNDD